MEEVCIDIHDVAFGGAGVGRLADGKVVFVPHTIAGEVVQVRLGKSRKGFEEAELLEVITPSPHRISPPCAYFGRCGGCQYQHVAYEEQMRMKEKQVRDILGRIGGFRNLPSIHVQPAPQSYAYRNKVTVHSSEKGELGFFANDNHTIIDVEHCLIANDGLNKQLSVLRKKSSKPRHAVLTDFAQRMNHARGVMNVDGKSFHQVNSAVASQLLEWIRQQVAPGAPQAGDTTSTQLLDLYCGSGFFTLGLADCFTEACGVDRDTRAIDTAVKQAKELNIRHVHFFAAAVEERIGWLLEGISTRSATILVDPPREGLPVNVVEAFSHKPGACLIYVSCNPATLARDLKRLMQTATAGYSLVKLAVFDMFPQTAHIETVAVLQRGN